MREHELRDARRCAGCGKNFGHTGLPLFWRVTIERFGVDMEAVRRQDGLAALLGGNSRLAQVMGADEEMTTPLMEAVTVTLCEKCAMEPVYMMALAEKGAHDAA